MERCFWCNLRNPLYVKYHDEEWGRLQLDDAYLFEMLILESFQAGLSWECVLNKRESFREAFDGFSAEIIATYSEDKICSLCENASIIRNKRKIRATVNNARIFLQIVLEYGSFLSYLKQFWNGEMIFDCVSTVSPISDAISEDLKKRGMYFVGSTIIYSFLQAIGVVNAHTENCFLYKGNIK